MTMDRDIDAEIMARGDWMPTASGGAWFIDDPRPEDLSYSDIVWGLARNCRYGGQIRTDVETYSVAEHSMLMYDWLLEAGEIRSREDGLKVLLDDASEAFFGDMITPVKKMIPDFKRIETRTQDVIADAYGFRDAPGLSYARIKEIDVRIRIDERDALVNEPARSATERVTWVDTPENPPLGVDIRCLPIRDAVAAFDATMRHCLSLPSVTDAPLPERLLPEPDRDPDADLSTATP